MADFWIKIEKTTADKPEILEMSEILNIDDPDTVLGKLIRVWAWFDSNSENGHAPSVTKVLIDRVTGVKGFTDALVTVGWMSRTDSGYYMSNFDRHLGKGAKKRASDAERKRKSRECHTQSVTEDETEKGLDKIREDKIKEYKKTNKKKTDDKKEVLEKFEVFWREYPKKQSRASALKSFIKLNPDQHLFDQIILKLRLFKQSHDWLKDGGQFIPMASTWINNQRWLDEIQAYEHKPVTSGAATKTQKTRDAPVSSQLTDRSWAEGFSSQKPAEPQTITIDQELIQ